MLIQTRTQSNNIRTMSQGQGQGVQYELENQTRRVHMERIKKDYNNLKFKGVAWLTYSFIFN